MLIARRATEIIAAAGRVFGGPVRVPALYCAEVVDAIEAAGSEVHYYDVMPDLSGTVNDDHDGVLIWHHAFGRYVTPPRTAGAVLVEDACFGLRTILPMIGRRASEPDLLVLSPRKEFGWAVGGVAIGRHVAAVRNEVAPAPAEVKAKWHRLDLAAEVERGTIVTAHARAVLGDRLPASEPGQDVLTVLPLLCGRRDATIDALRADGVPAWCWQRRLAGCSPITTPVAWELWKRLVLVPLPEPRSPAYRSLAAHTFDPWPV